jgi:hypothetical protein
MIFYAWILFSSNVVMLKTRGAEDKTGSEPDEEGRNFELPGAVNAVRIVR